MERFLAPETVRQLLELAAAYAIPLPTLEQVALLAYSDGMHRIVADWRETQQGREVLVCPLKARRQA